ncbi:uncharacterized protein LOC126897820 [Daktulosphaira vitifoliae]|uniref:uncharacterized protein LOC126897820 n=1 Tax=Daktulosphaira vitifoliae TaxID=58002 RepID=UPI0021A99DA0|nr:uncharacterized protein LOC126897820 [Daktulosphaira vitifoliae]
MIGYENKIMAQTVPKIASMQNSWCVTPPPPSYMSSISSHINLNQQQPQNLNDYSVSTADTSAADLDNFDLSLLLPQPAAEPPTSSEDGRVPTTEVLEHQQDILSQLTNYNNGSNCYTGADTLDTLDLTQLLSLYDDYCNSEVAAGEYQNMLKTSSDTTSVTTTAAIQIKEEVDDITTSRSPSTFITSSSPQSPPEVTYNVNCTWFVQDQPTSVVSSLECTKPQSSSVLLRSLLESNVKEELAVQSTTSDDDVETKPILQSTDSIKASSHKLLIEMLKGSTEDRTIEDDASTTPSVGSTSLISTASSSSTAVSDLAELLLYSPDQGVPTGNDEKSNSQKDSRLWEVVEQQQQWSHQNSKHSTHDMTVPSLSPQQNGGLDQVLFDDAAALVDGLLFGGDNVFKEQDGSMSPLNKANKDDVRLEAQMDMWKSLLLQQEQQEDDHRQKRNTTSVDRQQQPPLKRQRVDNEHDIMLTTTSLSSLGSISPASSTSSTLTMSMLDKNDNVMSTDCDKDEDDEFYVTTAATSPSSSSTRSSGSVSGSSGTSTQHHHHHIHLWQFLKELLQQYDDQNGLQSSAEDGKQTPSTIIRWLDRPKGVFKIEDSVAVAKLWGRRKNRPAMNYDKLSRSIRQYYKKGIMKKTERSQRLVYQFCHPYSGSPSTVCSNSTTTNVVAAEMSP